MRDEVLAATHDHAHDASQPYHARRAHYAGVADGAVTTVALRALAARRLRTALTAAAVLLGVALMAGTYILTDTINASFTDIFRETSKGVDVAVVPREAVQRQDADPPAFSASLLERVRSVKGVEEAAGGIFSLVSILGVDGKPIQTHGAPNFVAATGARQFDQFTYVAGEPPRAADEVAIDHFTADRHDFHVGQTLKVTGDQPARAYRITGIGKIGEVGSFGGASVAVMTLPEAQRMVGKEGMFDSIEIAAADGVSPRTLTRAIDSVLPDTVEVRTGEDNVEQQSQDIADDLGFLKTALLVFAGISLFVGGFTIFNTFSITVAQRTREFGLLRTLGATRRQVLRSVIIEALILGVGASALGVLAGLALASGLNALFKAFGIDLPNTGTVVATRTIVVSMLIGSFVTLLAALAPALRATRVSPMEALRDAAIPLRAARSRRATALALLLGAAGVALLLYGLFGSLDDANASAGLIGGGAVAILVAAALLSPRLVRPIAALVGWPLARLRGVTGRLARENATRNPGRTAATAAALMIGLATVTFVTVFAAGIRSSIQTAIDNSLAGDLVLQNVDGFSPIPARAGSAVAHVDGVAAVSPLAFSVSKLEGEPGTIFMSAIEPATVSSVLDIDWRDGSDATLAELRGRTALVDEAFADDHGLKVGESFRVKTPTGKRLALVVRGSFKDRANLLGDYVVSRATLRDDFGERQDGLAFVDLADGQGAGPARKRVSELLADRFPSVESLSQQQLKDKQASQVNQLLALVYALLSLAVIVSLFGIVNTLALAIHERTRELGMLRAIGASRRQVRQIVRWEAVITALIGATLGTALGVVFAALVSRPLADQGFKLSIPVPTLIILLVLAAIAGVVAAIGPARRAARLNVIEALAYE